jgi:hypothetical protein
MQATQRDESMQTTRASRIRLGAVCLALAGILFVLYPAIRPYSDETSLQGAQAFASSAWIVAHMLAMVAFTLVELGLLGLYFALQESAAERPAFWALAISVLAVGLTLPFYGGEAFGLHAIGQEAVKEQNVALVSLAQVVRTGPGLVMFAVGLVLLGAGAIVAAIAIWRSDVIAKWSGVPFALAFALYIPQFYGTPAIRVAHGVLVAVGCLWIAASMWRRSNQRVTRS